MSKTIRLDKEKSVGRDGVIGNIDSKNIYIEGDNLDALKILRETYLGKIDVVYIDPPYNTGNDILYKNNYGESQDEFGSKYELDEEGNRIYTNSETNGRYHTDWLNMMYQRILVSKDVIKDDGFFLVAIDHNELFNLGEICDEIFGYHNRIAIISVVHKPEGRNQAKFIGPSNEFLLVYAKNEQLAKIQKVAIDDDQLSLFSKEDDKGAYRLKNFIRLSDGKYSTRENKPAFWYPIYVSNDLKKMSLTEFDNSIAVYPVTTQGIERTWKTTPSTFIDRYKNGDIEAKNEDGNIVIYEKLRENQVIKTHWINKKYHGYHFGTKLLDDLLGVKTFDFPKSVYLMHDIFKLFTPKNGKILDFFSGSATSAHAIMMLNSESKSNREYIMVQIPAACDRKSEAYKAGYNTICDIGEERIRRAGKKIKEETGADIDYGFRCFKVDSSNMKDVYYRPAELKQEEIDLFSDNVKDDRTSEDLLIQVMLDLGIMLSSKIEIEDIDGKKIFSVADGYLLACFDKHISEKTVVNIAKRHPFYAVLRDSGMDNDSVATNFEQIFETYSPETVRRVL